MILNQFYPPSIFNIFHQDVTDSLLAESEGLTSSVPKTIGYDPEPVPSTSYSCML